MKVENQTVLKADDGKLLTNGDTFGKVVYLGKNDSVDNWHEIDETEIAEDGGESNG
jgi:hypothetical protein